MFWIKDTENGAVFKVKVQPRAAKNEIVGLLDDAVKLRITAPPVDGAANEAVVKFFSGLFRVPKNAVRIMSGETSRSKTVEIAGLTGEDIKKELNLT